MSAHLLSTIILRTLPASLALAITSLLAAPAMAANGTGISPQEQYQKEVEYCRSGQPGIDVQNCLRDAGAALQERRRSGQTSVSADELGQNQRARCDGMTGMQREDCLRLMSDTDVETMGSVEGGGVFRQKTITIPAN
ncbi:MAG TPA: hypothetical protein VK104_07200 [Burkholderiaceae bacterium]|nr:hypothetical protein [Burkholderiaceae bacterium]